MVNIFRGRLCGLYRDRRFAYFSLLAPKLQCGPVLGRSRAEFLDCARAKEHDPEDYSVFFQYGRIEQGATSHITLKPERAAALSNAFFAI